MKVRDRLAAKVCALIGHSRIQQYCFGYFNCARCGAYVGDSLGGIYDATTIVIEGHDCPLCRKNYQALGWKDKLLCPHPFKSKRGVKA